MFSYWNFFIILSNIFQIFGVFTLFARDYIPLSSMQIFVGIGCSLSWFSLSKYIEHASEYSYFSRTIFHAGPDIIRNLINVLPFFIGFAMLGMSVFWQGFRFREPSIAFFSLFCVMLGDEISNTFMETMQIDPSKNLDQNNLKF